MASAAGFLALSALIIILSGCCATVPQGNDTATPEPRAMGIVPDFNNTDRICVLPVLFIPSDASLSDSEIASSKQLLQEHLVLAQGLYQELLGTTFCVKNEVLIYRTRNNNTYFADMLDTSDRIVNELLDYDHEDRYNSDTIYLVVYVRPETRGNPRLLGGGRTINGPPGTGGGYVELEYSSLVRDHPYPFQFHELGHSFGLTHPDCFGYDINTSDTIMSYNPRHHSEGLAQSDDPGTFLPQEYFELSLNKRAFPDFNYQESQALDPNAIQRCFLGPMDEGIGAYAYFPGVGYELFFDGNLVNGPDASLYSLKRAQENCEWNRENHDNIAIECRYNGQAFYKSD